MKLCIFIVLISYLMLLECRPNNNQKIGKVRYDNYRVYTILFQHENQLDFLKDFKAEDDYSIWLSIIKPDNNEHQIDIMIKPDKDFEFQEIMRKNEFKFHIKIENLQNLIDDETPINFKERNNFDWTKYHTLDEINNWIDEQIQKYPEIVTKFSIGKSYENRNIYGIKISYKNDNPGIFIESHIHAREWITSATATYLINELLTSSDSNVRNIAETIDWYIIPVLNVDGFVYTYEKDRMWRKTRQPNSNSNCIGTDGNRNFDDHWMENGGASSNECSETYAGSKPFSEPETLALSTFYESIKNDISIYLSFHSYGQLLLSPYGHTSTEFPPNYNDLLAVAKATANAIKIKYNTNYIYGSTASVLYTASGVSPDWAYNNHGVKLAYTFEFRDTGNYGFVLPPNQIQPNGEETVLGIVGMITEARSRKLI